MKTTHLTQALDLLRQASLLIQTAAESPDEQQACAAADRDLDAALDTLIAVAEPDDDEPETGASLHG